MSHLSLPKLKYFSPSLLLSFSPSLLLSFFIFSSSFFPKKQANHRVIEKEIYQQHKKNKREICILMLGFLSFPASFPFSPILSLIPPLLFFSPLSPSSLHSFSLSPSSLYLGAGGTGKSTFAKQMKIMFSKEEIEQQRELYVDVVDAAMVDVIDSLLFVAGITETNLPTYLTVCLI